MRRLDALVGALTGLAVFALLIGYLGVLHPFFDSVGVMRLHVLISLTLAFVYFLVRRQFKASLFSLIVVLGGLSTIWPLILIGGPNGNVSLYQANILFRNDATETIAYISQIQPDIVTLQEVTSRALPNLMNLPEYPTKIHCDFSGVGGVMVLSRFPPVEEQSGCEAGSGMVWARLQTPDGPVTVVSLHLYWPWPHSQATQLDQLEPRLASLPAPVIVAGDFNNVPWSHAIFRVTKATDTKIIPGIRLSLDIYKGWGRFPIDHVLIPTDQGYAETTPRNGSDHRGILAHFMLRQ